MNTKAASRPIACTLNSAELLERKRTVIAELKGRVLMRTEDEKSITYLFEGTENTISLATRFVAAERLCCSFLDFTMSLSASDNTLQLTLSGPDGAKEFVRDEIGF